MRASPMKEDEKPELLIGTPEFAGRQKSTPLDLWVVKEADAA